MKLQGYAASDHSLEVSKFIGSPLIRTFDKQSIAPIIGQYIAKANKSFGGEILDAGELAEMCYDLIELMGYESVEDIAMMFKMFRQGKLTQDKHVPFRQFNSYNVCKVLVPEYLRQIGEKKAEIREIKSKESKKIAYIGNAEKLSMMKLVDSVVDEMVKVEVVQLEVDDQFKRSVEALELEDLHRLLETYRGYPELKDRRAYLNLMINRSMESE